MADRGAVSPTAPVLGPAREGRTLVRHPGNEELFQALAWSVAGVRRGWPLHVHVEGLRGTGKTTIVRDFRRHLPLIRRVRGCLYQCDPDAPHCPDHRDLSPEELAAVGEEWVPAPFLEVSASAKIGTLVGSLDLARVVDRDRPDARLLPGTLAQAHRGVVFVDEINRLADTAPELADALLDVMGTKPGRLQIEETGLPRVVLPASVTVWAASNPDEEPGPLADVRRQLADRFDLVVAMQRPASVEVVRRILASPRPGGADVGHATADFRRADADGQQAGADVRQAGADVRQADAGAPLTAGSARPAGADAQTAGDPSGTRWPDVSDAQRDFLASAYVRFQLESLRAVEAWQAAARLAAACRESERVEAEDLLAAAGPALRHRVEPEVLPEILAYARERLGPAPGEDDLDAAALTPAGAASAARMDAGARSEAAGGAADEAVAGAGAGVGAAPGVGGSGPAAGRGLGQARAFGVAGRAAHPDDGVPPWSRLFQGWRGAFGSGARRADAGAPDAGPDGRRGGSRTSPGAGASGEPGTDSAGGSPSASAHSAARGVGRSSVADPRDTPSTAPRRPARHLADWDTSPLWRSDHVDD